jgi:hypothetical protein
MLGSLVVVFMAAHVQMSYKLNVAYACCRYDAICSVAMIQGAMLLPAAATVAAAAVCPCIVSVQLYGWFEGLQGVGSCHP